MVRAEPRPDRPPAPPVLASSGGVPPPPRRVSSGFGHRDRNCHRRGAGGGEAERRPCVRDHLDEARGGVRRARPRTRAGHGHPQAGSPPSWLPDRPAARPARGRWRLRYVRRNPGAFGLDAGDMAGLREVRRYRSGSGATHSSGSRSTAASRSSAPRCAPTWTPRAADQPRAPAAAATRRCRRSSPTLSERAAVRAAEARRAREGWCSSPTWTASGWPGACRPRRTRAPVGRGGRREDRGDALSGQPGARATARAFDNYPGAPRRRAGRQGLLGLTGADPWLTAAETLLPATTPTCTRTQRRQRRFPPADPSPQPADEIAPSAPGRLELRPGRRARHPGSALPIGGCSCNRFGVRRFSWHVNQAQAGTQLFYFVNTYHDHLRDAPGIGFDGSSGDFEGGDRVRPRSTTARARRRASRPPTATTPTTPS